MDFKIESAYKPTGDQPQAIEELCNGLKNGADYQTASGRHWFRQDASRWQT